MAAWIVAPLLLAAVGWGWWRGVVVARASRREVAELLARKARLAEENAALRRDVTALAREPAARGRAARETLGVAAPGEIVVVVPPTPTSRN